MDDEELSWTAELTEILHALSICASDRPEQNAIIQTFMEEKMKNSDLKSPEALMSDIAVQMTKAES
jgi:hypothetical protein